MVDTRVLIGRALDAASAGLEPFIAERFKELLPELTHWTHLVREKDQQNGRGLGEYSASDLGLMLRTITERLGQLGYPFQGVLSRQISNCASELRTVRNQWAHGEKFTAAEAYRALDTAERLLEGIGAEGARKTVGSLKLEALTAMHSGLSAVPQPTGSGASSAEVSSNGYIDEAGTRMVESARVEARAPQDVTHATIEFEINAVDTLSYALAHSRVAIVNEVSVSYRGPELRGASLEVQAYSSHGPLGAPKVVLLDLDGEATTILRDVAFTLDPGSMLSLDTQQSGYIQLTLRDPSNEVIKTHTHPVDLLASNQWIGRPLQLGLELIASFVQPNAAEISVLAAEAATILGTNTGNTSLDGYQSGSVERVDAMARSVYEAMQARQIRYAEPPASWGLRGQKVRSPEEVLTARLGTCLDTTVTFAAVLEEIGINCTLWFVPGHVFVGYWRVESSLDTPAETDASEAMNHVGLGSIRLLETTSVPLGESFETATRRPMLEHMSRGNNHFDGITDILQARQAGIYPLPSRALDEAGQTIVREYRVAASAPAIDFVPKGAHASAESHSAAPVRVTQWKNALLDLSLRNKLINYSSSGGHSLAVPQPTLAFFEDLINSGTSVTLVPSDKLSEIDRSRGVRSGLELPEALRADMLTARKQVFVDIGESAYPTRLRNLAYKARTIIEETGANNLYLAVGMMRWQTGDREVRSPLILIPVTLSSTARGQAYQISLDEAGESTPNYCLLEKLRTSLGLEIPGLGNPARDESGIDLEATLAATRRALADAKLPFTVEDTVDLAVLQFAKFRLWKDIDENWDTFSENPLVHHLVNSPTDSFADPIAAPTNPDFDAVLAELPVPADSTQVEAVIEAVGGRTFVLEGPPGTGKSQTITNLLAHSIAQGKKVLFVAEKRAALEVVKQRLDSVGLGDLCLDLHDKGARPNAVRGRITTALDAAFKADKAQLASSRDSYQSSVSSLRRYAERLHTNNAFGLSYYGARDRWLAADADAPTLTVSDTYIRSANQESVELIRAALRSLPETADLASPAPLHPWGFVDYSTGHAPVHAIFEAARNFDSALANLTDGGVDTETLSVITNPMQIETWAVLCTAPRYSTELLQSLATRRGSGELADLRSRIQSLAEQVPAWAAKVEVEILSRNAAELHTRAQAADASGFFGRKKRQRAVLAELDSVLKIDPKNVPPKEVSQLTLEIAQTERSIEELVQWALTVPVHTVTATWNPYLGLATQSALETLDWLEWLIPVMTPHTSLPEDLGSRLRSYYAGSTSDTQIAAALNQYATAWRQLEALMSGPSDNTNGSKNALSDWSHSAGLMETWRTTAAQRRLDIGVPVGLEKWLAFLEQLEPVRRLGLVEAYAEIRNGAVSADDAVLAFEKGLAKSTLNEREESQGLAAFDATAHNRAIARFTASSASIRRELPRWIPQQVVDQRSVDPRFDGGAMGELKRQLGRKRGGMSVRALFENYESIIMQLVPCVLMSPESVARFFPARSGMFDIVVFDEASQIRVADAVGAMGRGRSVVVVGDSKQMPPSSFAESRTSEIDEQIESQNVIVDEESILTECVQSRVPQRWLSWHYRSQDESLITFSNHTYYESKLSSFPAPANPATIREQGVSLVRVNGHFERTGKGKTLRTNQAEAQAIVTEIARRFRTSTQEFPSIGVVTFNAQQRALIETMLRDHTDERLAAALDERDGLFVKNLENVQGDERDTILFSIAFSANDRGVVPLNFGPLTRAGGERRFNVAITRARKQVVLFASFEPGDLRTENTASVGIRHLRAYLEFAARGIEGSSVGVLVPTFTDRHRDEIAAELRLRGFAVETDVGLSDFRVDISVATADKPGRSLLAILLDGESWRLRQTVADRDGLPTDVLGNLMRWPGVERVWLPEWLQDREATLDRIAKAVHQAEEKINMPMDAPEVREQVHSVLSAPVTAAASHAPFDGDVVAISQNHATAESAPIRSGTHRAAELGSSRIPPAHRRLTEFNPWSGSRAGSVETLDSLPAPADVDAVAQVIRKVIAAEGPIERGRLVKHVGESFGLSRVVSARASSIVQCIPKDLIRSEGDQFIWPSETSPENYLSVRKVEHHGRRDIDTVPLEEIANAMGVVAELSGGIDSESVRREAIALFGGKRVTAGMGERLDAAMHLAVSTGRLHDQNGLWMVGHLS